MTMMLLLAGMVLAFGGIAWALLSDGSSKQQKKRLAALTERHSPDPMGMASAQMRKMISNREAKVDTALSGFLPRPAMLRLRLEQTGKPIRIVHYVGATVGIAVAAIAFLFAKNAPAPLALFGGLFLGLFLPHAIIGFMIKRRVKKFIANFPDAIELMVRGLRSGLPITETMQIVANEIAEPVSTEFRSVSDQMKIGQTMEAALQSVSDRLGTNEFAFFVITLAIQRETGGNLAETLSNLADVLRKRFQMVLKIKAMSSEAKASAGIIGSLPFFVFGAISMMNPGYVAPFFTDTRLMIAGIGGLIWMSIGVFIMAKMINFEI